MRPRNLKGFSVIELMTALAVIALLAAMAVPTMRSVIENGRIRTAATSIQSGLTQARAEAVRLNTQVEFVLTGDGWQVRRPSGGAVLHQSAGMEVSSSGLTLEIEPADADRITFNAFGLRTSINSDETLPMTSIDIQASNPSGSSSYRPLTVQLLSSGMARLCDPAADADQPRACL